jgi:shikimate dehydrogenase
MTTYGLIGYPLVHSFSRKYFTEKFAAEGLDAEYLNFEIPSIGQLPSILQAHPDLRGLNVTIPYKEQVISYLDALDEGARAIGAVNVIRISHSDGRTVLKGYNADVIGFMDSLHPLLRPHHRQALVLGTGGASKAITYGLRQLGITPTLVSRTPRKGMLAYSDLDEEVMRKYLVIVNCTPVGTYPKVDACPDIPYRLLTPDHLLYDLVYNPEKTLFLQRGEAQGAQIKNGLEMLHRQAEASWDFWHIQD